MRRAAKDKLLDRAHRGVVYTMLGLTAYGTYLLGLRVHRYFTVIRPANMAKELEMIKEGAHDKAPELKA